MRRLFYLLGEKCGLDSFVLVTDGTTELPQLHATLTGVWSRMDAGAPNASLAEPVVRLLHEPSPRALVAALCDAAVAGGWRPIALQNATIPGCSNTST